MKNKVNLLILIILVLLGSQLLVYGQEYTHEKDLLTKEEITYLKSLGRLKIAYVDGVAPLQYRNDKGEDLGVSISIMEEIASMLNLDIEYVRHQSLRQLQDMDYHIALTISPNYLPDGFYASKAYFKTELLIVYNGRLKWIEGNQ